MRVRELIERLEELDPDLEVGLAAQDALSDGRVVTAWAPAERLEEKPLVGKVVVSGSGLSG